MAAALVVGIAVGWLRGRRSLIRVDVGAAVFQTRRERWTPLYVVCAGLLTLLAANLYTGLMLRLLNSFLLMGVATESSHRLYLLLAWWRARSDTAETLRGNKSWGSP